jgi:thiol-disulfide isomerase/thioredoxin
VPYSSTSARPGRLAALALLLACLTACDSRSVAPDAAGPSDGTDASTVVQLLREPMAVEPFTVTDLDGRTLSSADWKGKVVLVNFWATWCPPCLAEIPDLIALQNKYRDRLVVVGISEDEISPEIVKRFATEKKINYPIAMTSAELQTRFTGITALPTTFVLDPDGQIAYKRVGILQPQQTEGVTRALAGMSLNARIERVDDPARLSAEGVAQIKDVPGVDLSGIAPDKKAEVLQALNSENCTCGCGLSVAKCRIDDPQCDVSLPLAKKIVAKYTSAP